jgi:uncharacterized protein YndB with AHSA1/START domain
MTEQRRLNHPPEVVWRSITDPTEIERWTGSRPQIDLRPGGAYVWAHHSGDRIVDRVVQVDPPVLFAHTFSAQADPSALVTWRITPVANGCLLVLTAVVSRDGAGWRRLLDRMVAVLEGSSPAKDLARYATMLEA